MKRSLSGLALFACASAALAACDESALPDPSKAAAPAHSASATAAVSAEAPLPPMPKADPLPATPQGLPELKTPADNPLTAEKVALGKQLFFDKRLSKDGSASCETCHVPEKGWTDGTALSTKVGGGKNTRHSPTLINVGYNDLYYWDGRAETLEKQIAAAWKGQMGAEDQAAIATAVGKIPGYKVQFKTIFNADATPDNVIKALASFVRTIRSGGSAWDKRDNGDKNAAPADAVKGFDVFTKKAGCAACHAPPLYTDNGFHDVGIGSDAKEPDQGRGKITKDDKDNGKFKTPSLRAVGTHAPFFHDGSAATLAAAVDTMAGGGVKNKNLDEKLKPVKLSKDERAQLDAFLKALEPAPEAFNRPTLPQ